MTRKRLLVTVAVLAGLALVGWPVAYRHLHPRFTKGMAARIRVGMTEADVVALLGRPPGDYSGPEAAWVSSPADLRRHAEGITQLDGSTHKGWISDAGWVAALFGPDGRVIRAYGEGSFTPPEPSAWDVVRGLVF